MKPLITSQEAAKRIQAEVRRYQGCESYERVEITNATSQDWKPYCLRSGPNALDKCYEAMIRVADDIRREFDLSDAVKLTYPLPLKPQVDFEKPIIETLADAENFLRSQPPDPDSPVMWDTTGAAIEEAKRRPGDETALLHATRSMQEALRQYRLMET